MSRMKFMNTEIDNLTMDEALRRIDKLIQKNNNAYVVTPNVNHIVRLEKDKELQEAYKHADLILTDGKPLIWMSKWYGTPIKEKVSGSDLFYRLCEMAAIKDYGVFFLGAAEGVAEKAASKMMLQYPGLRVVGTLSPRNGFEKDEVELERIIRIVKAAAPQILMVCLGCPKQELFVFNHKQQLGVPISLCIGASLDFAAGIVKRAPKWMSEHGVEWVFRIKQEPKRLLGRYVNDAICITKYFFKYWIKK